MSLNPSEKSVQYRTAMAVIEAYNTWTAESVLSFRAPNCIHEILPKSLNRPVMNNTTYASYFIPLLPAFKDFHIIVHDTIVDIPENKVAIWCSSTAKTEIGPYKNEYMIILYLSEDGTNVERFLEYVDSNNSTGFLGRLREFLAAKNEGTADGKGKKGE